MKIKNLNEMSVAECEDAQRALLYPWERADWENASLDWSNENPRSELMYRLDRRISAIRIRSERSC